MRPLKKKELQHKDDTLFGLLSAYKQFITYVRVLLDYKNQMISVQLCDNPKNWSIPELEKYSTYEQLRRLDIGCSKLSIKYLSPELLVKIVGPLLGIKIPPDKAEVINLIQERGIFIFETSSKFSEAVIEGLVRLIGMSPQKKYELLEKSIVNFQD